MYRYMRLGAYLSLLKGDLFVPKLRTLRENSDPTEGQLLLTSESFVKAWSGFDQSCDWQGDLERFEEDSLQTISSEKDLSIRPFLVENYYNHVADSRAVLCFCGSDQESMAMWQIFARDGVLIQTTCGALGEINLGSNKSSVLANIRYRNVGANLEKEYPQLVARPQLFKLKCYEFENEIRWFTSIEGSGPGLCLNIDSKRFVKKVVLSPFMFRNEADAVKRISESVLGQIDISQSSGRFIRREYQYGIDQLSHLRPDLEV